MEGVNCSFKYVDASSVNLCDGVSCTQDSNCESQYCGKDGLCGESPIEAWLLILLIFAAVILIVFAACYYMRQKKKNGGCFSKEKERRKISPPPIASPTDSEDGRLLTNTQVGLDTD